jgi:A/G-specific adenine glycosylase
MELGAMICTPRAPQCDRCPVARDCVARRTSRVEELPKLRPRAAATPRRFAAFVVGHRGRFVVRQRPAGVVNAHLWEFPNVELSGDSDLHAAAREALGFTAKKLLPFRTIRHSITRYRITLEAHRAEPAARTSLSHHAGEWRSLEELEGLSFCSAHGKILQALRNGAS